MADETPPVLPPAPLLGEKETFWQRTVTKGAIVMTVMLLFLFSDSIILQEPVDRKEVALGFKALVIAWLAAFGIHTSAPTSWRR